MTGYNDFSRKYLSPNSCNVISQDKLGLSAAPVLDLNEGLLDDWHEKVSEKFCHWLSLLVWIAARRHHALPAPGGSVVIFTIDGRNASISSAASAIAWRAVGSVTPTG